MIKIFNARLNPLITILIFAGGAIVGVLLWLGISSSIPATEQAANTTNPETTATPNNATSPSIIARSYCMDTTSLTPEQISDQIDVLRAGTYTESQLQDIMDSMESQNVREVCYMDSDGFVFLFDVTSPLEANTERYVSINGETRQRYVLFPLSGPGPSILDIPELIKDPYLACDISSSPFTIGGSLVISCTMGITEVSSEIVYEWNFWENTAATLRRCQTTTTSTGENTYQDTRSCDVDLFSHAPYEAR